MNIPCVATAHCKHVVTPCINQCLAITMVTNRIGDSLIMIAGIAGAAIGAISGGKGGGGKKGGGGGGGPMELIGKLINKVKGAVTGGA